MTFTLAEQLLATVVRVLEFNTGYARSMRIDQGRRPPSARDHGNRGRCLPLSPPATCSTNRRIDALDDGFDRKLTDLSGARLVEGSCTIGRSPPRRQSKNALHYRTQGFSR